ncbi:MAG: hypothetical protein MZV64_24395 [Ignavibacteriales bacterium]|nr:hypothetical protein [Ignavibacteriales bacterium]
MVISGAPARLDDRRVEGLAHGQAGRRRRSAVWSIRVRAPFEGCDRVGRIRLGFPLATVYRPGVKDVTQTSIVHEAFAAKVHTSAGKLASRSTPVVATAVILAGPPGQVVAGRDWADRLQSQARLEGYP